MRNNSYRLLTFIFFISIFLSFVNNPVASEVEYPNSISPASSEVEYPDSILPASSEVEYPDSKKLTNR